MRAQEFVQETVPAQQVLQYVKQAHAPDEFDIEYSITDHPEWQLTNIPLSQLNLDPDGEQQDPYSRVNWVDYDKVAELVPRIGSVLRSMPIVVDAEGWIIDGNHRATAAAEAGLTSVPAYVPAQKLTESFNQCFNRACQLYDRAEAKGIDATLLQVADYQGDGSTADARWQRLPQYVWKHYVTVIGDTVYDPTAEQFGPRRPKKYSLDELKSQWKEIYTIRSTAVNEDIYDVLQPLNCGPFDGGCVLVAQALQQIHGGRVVVLVDADGRAQHAAVLANGQLIDYDGAADPKEFVQQFERNERANIQGIRPIRDHDLPDAPRDAKLIPQIVQALSENFADGKVKGKSRPGRFKRAGVSCKGSVTSLRKKAKNSSGERQKGFHWCANMKAGKKK